MTIAPSTPIIVGVGQFTELIGAPEYAALSSADIAARAAERAFADAKSLDALRQHVDAIATTRTFEDSTPRRAQPFGKPDNYPRAVANRLGLAPRVAVWEKAGGNTPQQLVSEFGARLSNGEFRMVLLAGGDAGAGRMGLRPDSLTLASIDARTGKSVLIGLPRNMSNFPFKEGSVMAEQFPQGFDCDECMLNGVSTWAVDHADLFKRKKDAGMTATISAVEGITGLEVSYWVLVDMAGFRDVVDAFGGVELNVRDRIPVGLPHEDYFHYIDPGVRRLDGQDTLWFARARHGSDDYSRMARQKCVMSAMVSQVNPAQAVLNLREIMEAGSSMLSTNMPGSEFDTFIALALKAKSQKIASVSLVPPLLHTSEPDIDVAHRAVADTIERSENPPAAGGSSAKKKPRGSGSVTGGSVGTLSDGYAANDSDDVAAAC